MIRYKVDSKPLTKANTRMKDMDAVLSEVPNTLRMLQEILAEHEASISSPTLSNFRLDIQHMIPEAVRLTHLIAQYTQKLADASNQAGTELVAVEENIKSSLTIKPAAAEPIAEVIRLDNQSFRVFQRQ